MSHKLPQLRARQIIRALRKAGWFEDYQTGGHLFMSHPDRPGHVTIPVHGSKDVKPGTVRAIIQQAGLSVDEFRRLL